MLGGSDLEKQHLDSKCMVHMQECLGKCLKNGMGEVKLEKTCMLSTCQSKQYENHKPRHRCQSKNSPACLSLLLCPSPGQGVFRYYYYQSGDKEQKINEKCWKKKRNMLTYPSCYHASLRRTKKKLGILVIPSKNISPSNLFNLSINIPYILSPRDG